MAELIAILVGSILLLVLIQYAQRKTSQLSHQYYAKKWQEIKTMERASAAARRLAVIEADKTLDKALKDLNFKGATMGDRMKNAGKLMGKVDNVWFAHKMRNRLVHEDAKPKKAEIRRAINAFEAALKKLGAL